MNWVKGKGLATCFSGAYMSKTYEKQCFTVSDVEADRQPYIVYADRPAVCSTCLTS